MNSNLPIVPVDVWRKATVAEKLDFLALLSTLPPGAPPADPEAQTRAFDIVLEDVTAYALETAGKLLVKGRAAIGHKFAPAPNELGMLLDRVMQPHVEAEHERRRYRWEEDIPRDQRPPRPEGRPLGSDRLRKLDAAVDPLPALTQRQRREQALIAERAGRLAANGMTAERLAAIPDAPGSVPQVAALLPPLLLLAPPFDPAATLTPPWPPTVDEQRHGVDVDESGIVTTDAFKRACIKRGWMAEPKPAAKRQRRKPGAAAKAPARRRRPARRAA